MWHNKREVGGGGSLRSEQESQMNSAQQDVELHQCLPNTSTVSYTCYIALKILTCTEIGVATPMKSRAYSV